MAASAYSAAGVDIAAGDRAVELMRQHWLLRGVPGSWAGWAVSLDSSTLPRSRDSGTRFSPPPPTASAPKSRSRLKAMGINTVGFDLVGMLVDDLVVVGAEPLFMTDYIACGKVVRADRRDRRGDRLACVVANCLLGGERPNIRG